MDWKKKVMLFYLAGGLICGIIAGIVTLRNAEENNTEVDLTLQDAGKIGMNALKMVGKAIIK